MFAADHRAAIDTLPDGHTFAVGTLRSNGMSTVFCSTDFGLSWKLACS